LASRSYRDSVTARGNRREPIYEDEADRSAFLDIFGTVVEDSN